MKNAQKMRFNLNAHQLIFVATLVNMADDKSLIGSSGIDHTAIIEPFVQEIDSLLHDITSIHSKITSFTLRLDGEEEIDAEALELSDQSAKLLMSTIEGRASHLMQMASSISAKARAEAARAGAELNEMHNDARREDAMRRGIIPFAGGRGTHSVLSVLYGAHSIGGGIFGYLNMIDSNKVRGLCVECRKAVMDFPWMDEESIIKGSVKAWRAAFPVARAVNVSGRNDIVDADFVHIRGDKRVRLHTVNMRNCKSVTDAAFVHLRGIQKLNMNCCNQMTITDAAFVHLRGIHTLWMSCCDQATITDAAFVYLRGIHELDIEGCNQMTITVAALVHLVGIKILKTERCSRDVRIAAAQVMDIDYESEAADYAE